jgi:hypothetical protein
MISFLPFPMQHFNKMCGLIGTIYKNAKAGIARIISKHKVTARQTLVLWIYLHFLYHQGRAVIAQSV